MAESAAKHVVRVSNDPEVELDDCEQAGGARLFLNTHKRARPWRHTLQVCFPGTSGQWRRTDAGHCSSTCREVQLD